MHIGTLISQDIRKRREADSRAGSFHVTDLSKCQRGVLIARRNPHLVSHDDRELRVFECGHIFEDFALRSMPLSRVISRQEKVEWPEYNLVGSSDAILVDDDGNPVLTELKSQHSQAFHWMHKRGGAQEHHQEQINLYFSKLKDVYKGLKMLLVYISKDDLCTQEYIITPNQPMVDAALKRAAALKEHWEKNTLPPQEDPVKYDSEKKKWTVDWKAKYCPVHAHCMKDADWLSKAEKLVKQKNVALTQDDE